MGETLSWASYDALVAAATTTRAEIVVRLAGEAGLRTSELPRVRPGDLREPPTSSVALLAVPTADGDAVDREAPVPASLAASLRAYAERMDLDDTDPFVPVSTRRIQMLVRETGTRAAETRPDPALSSVTPRALRERFARWLLRDRGLDPNVVRAAGGWETLAALDDHLESLDGDAVAAALDRADRPDVVPFLEAVEAATEATGRDRLFETVTARLAASDRFRDARVVRRTPSTDRVEPGDPPWREAIEGGTVTTAVVDGVRWVAAPVRHGETTYGALCLAVDDALSPTAADRRATQTVGRCLGWAVTAGRWRELLHSDGVTAVEFHTSAAADVLASTSAAVECELTLESTVPVSADAARWFLTVTGAGPQAVADALTAPDAVGSLSVVETRADGCTVSVRATGGSIVHALSARGARIREATAVSGSVRVAADFPDGTAIRQVADDLRRAYTGTRLTSKESTTRRARTESALREDATSRLTDRQLAALSAAYHSGYFDWPRDSTAEEVADAMDVSSPTFHNHLRKAERAMFDALFEPASAEPRRDADRHS
jgi:predicted DNA binding protein